MKVCLSFSAYHPELWQPAWGIRLILEALISFLPTKGDGAIGALEWPSEERKRLAKESFKFNCPICGNCHDVLQKWERKIQNKVGKSKDGKSSRFEKEIEQLHAFQIAAEGERKAKTTTGDDQEVNEEDSKVQNDKEKNSCNDGTVQDETRTETSENETIVLKQNDDDNIDVAESKSEQASNEKELVPALDSKGNIDDDLNVDATCSTSKVLDKEKCGTNESDEDSEIQSNMNENDASSKKEHTEPLTHVESPDTATTILKEEKVKENIENDANKIPLSEEESHIVRDDSLDTPWVSDPVVHSGIVVLSFIIYLLTRKVQAIIVEMKELESEFDF